MLWKGRTKDLLRSCLGILSLVLLLESILGCTAAPVKSEIWLIDAKEIALYRVISDTEEEAIPIKDNPDMDLFLCMPKEEMKKILEDKSNATIFPSF